MKIISSRSCCYCGASAKLKSILCKTCWAVLYKIKSPTLISDYKFLPFPIFFLFKWVPDQSPLLNTLLICLKNPGTNLFHKDFAELLALERGFLNRTQFVPVPASVTGERDHAHFLAWEMARIYRGAFQSSLLWQSKVGRQRGKGKKERAKIKMVMRGGPKKPLINHKVILVDDVITTGATALKAYEALGRPKEFELWCLACRQPSSLV